MKCTTWPLLFLISITPFSVKALDWEQLETSEQQVLAPFAEQWPDLDAALAMARAKRVRRLLDELFATLALLRVQLFDALKPPSVVERQKAELEDRNRAG